MNAKKIIIAAKIVILCGWVALFTYAVAVGF
jgi:hypothetical protein